MKIARTRAAQAAAFFVALLLAAPVLSAPTLSWTVDCSRGQSIGRALDHAPPGFKLTLTVRGTCNEAVVIERDDVTLQGDAVAGAIINAPRPEIGITVRAMRVLIDRMTVEGGSDGVMVYGAMDTYVTNTTIRDVARWGLVSKNGHTFVTGCTIVGSGQDGVSLQRGSARLIDCQIRANRGAGIAAVNASGLNITGSAVTANGASGIAIANGSQARIYGNTITGNGTDPSAFGTGVSVTEGSNADVNGNTISNNAAAGLHVADKSVALMTGNTISGNGANGVQAFDSSQATLWNNTISGNGTNPANTVNFRNGVAVFSSAASAGGNQITGHSAAGVRVLVSNFGGGDNVITGNGDGLIAYNARLVLSNGNTLSHNRGFGLLLNQTSSAQVSGATIQHNAWDGIMVQWGSTLVLFQDAVTTSGGNGGWGLHCPDAKSSVVGLDMLVASPPNAAGSVSPTCTGF